MDLFLIRVIRVISGSLAYLHLFAKLVDRDVRDLRLGHLYSMSLAAETLRFDLYVDGNGCAAHPHCFGVETDKIAHEHWFEKDDLLHRNGNETVMSSVPDGFDAAGDVDVA